MGERPRLGELLIDSGAIAESQLAAALGEQKQWGRPLGMTLVRMGFLEEETLVRVLARQLKLPVAWLRGKRVNPEVLDLLPPELAEKHHCLPLFLNDEAGGRVLYLAMEDPTDLTAVDDIGFQVGFKIRPVLAGPSELDEALHRHYHWGFMAGEAPSDPSPHDEVSEANEPELLMLDEEVGNGRGSGTALPVSPLTTAKADTERPHSPASSVQPVVILRALTRLLIEKGVMTREELVERVRLAADGEDDGSL
jgi:type IV pilus assembly protein PilB